MIIRRVYSKWSWEWRVIPGFFTEPKQSFWREHGGRCKAGKGSEQSTEGVNFQPGQLDGIREGGVENSHQELFSVERI